MNNLECIRGIEDGMIRGDPFDGVDRLARGTKAMMQVKDLEPPMNITGHWTLGMSNSDLKTINLFCMYALRPSAGSFPIDRQCLSLGDYGLVFTKPQQFFDRLVSVLTAESITSRADLVEYVDGDYTGEIGPFRKLKQFSWQSEWRLVCYNGPGGVRRILIGNLLQISIIMPSAEVIQGITISYREEDVGMEPGLHS